MFDKTAPIGVFDSGIGGLTVFEEIKKILPHENLIYFADSIHLPYGDRAIDEIYQFTESITTFLKEYGCKIIVIACNTASAAALYKLRKLHPTFNFIGMEPAVKPAVEKTNTGKIGVIATAATFQGELFKSVVERYAQQVEVISQPCPGLVQQIELGELETYKTEEMLKKWILPMIDAGIDRLVLGCTHYPFVIKTINKITQNKVEVIDPAPSVARHLKSVVEKNHWLNNQSSIGNKTYITTGNTNEFVFVTSKLNLCLSNVQQAKWDKLNIKIS